MKDNTIFQTKDFYIAASILASGFQLLELIPISGKTYFFVFDASKIKAEAISQAYWQRELNLPIRNFVDAIHELKTRIYAGK